MHNWLITYDIEDHRSRRQSCRLLRRFSNGYQDSGFEVRLPTPPQTAFASLQRWLADSDSLLVTRSEATPDWQLGRTNSLPTTHLLLWI